MIIFWCFSVDDEVCFLKIYDVKGFHVMNPYFGVGKWADLTLRPIGRTSLAELLKIKLE